MQENTNFLRHRRLNLKSCTTCNNVANFLHAKEIVSPHFLDSLQLCGQVDFITYEEKYFKQHLLDHIMGHLHGSK